MSHFSFVCAQSLTTLTKGEEETNLKHLLLHQSVCMWRTNHTWLVGAAPVCPCGTKWPQVNLVVINTLLFTFWSYKSRSLIHLAGFFHCLISTITWRIHIKRDWHLVNLCRCYYLFCFSCSSQLLATRMSILASSQFFLLLYMFSSVPGGYVIIWYIHNLTIFHCCWWNLYTLHHHQTFVQLLHTVYEIFSFIGMKYLPVLIPFDHNLIQIFCWRLREICVPIFFIFYDMIKYLIWAFTFMNFVLQESLVYMDLVSSLNFQLEQETW